LVAANSAVFDEFLKTVQKYFKSQLCEK